MLVLTPVLGRKTGSNLGLTTRVSLYMFDQRPFHGFIRFTVLPVSQLYEYNLK